MTPAEARDIVAKKHGFDSFDDLLVSFGTMKDGFELVHKVCDEATKLHFEENRWHDFGPNKKDYRDLQGKSVIECLDLRFIGAKAGYVESNNWWQLYSHQKGGADYGFELYKRDDGYYLMTMLDSGYSKGEVVAGPMDEDKADRIAECFGSTRPNFDDDPS